MKITPYILVALTFALIGTFLGAYISDEKITNELESIAKIKSALLGRSDYQSGSIPSGIDLDRSASIKGLSFADSGKGYIKYYSGPLHRYYLIFHFDGDGKCWVTRERR